MLGIFQLEIILLEYSDKKNKVKLETIEKKFFSILKSNKIHEKKPIKWLQKRTS